MKLKINILFLFHSHTSLFYLLLLDYMCTFFSSSQYFIFFNTQGIGCACTGPHNDMRYCRTEDEIENDDKITLPMANKTLHTYTSQAEKKCIVYGFIRHIHGQKSEINKRECEKRKLKSSVISCLHY